MPQNKFKYLGDVAYLFLSFAAVNKNKNNYKLIFQIFFTVFGIPLCTITPPEAIMFVTLIFQVVKLKFTGHLPNT